MSSEELDTFEVNLVDLLMEATEEVFSTMMGIETVLLGRSHAKDEANVAHRAFEEAGDRVELEAIVNIDGPRKGAVILRAGHDGALDIARGLLMLPDGEALEISEVMDALGEAANMVGGVVKTRALDPMGTFQLSTPEIAAKVEHVHERAVGSLVYKLSRGCTSVEVWMDGGA